MIHCLDENDPMDLQPELVVKVPLDEDDLVEGEELGEGFVEAGINVRPHLIKMIQQASKNFQVITFTASDRSYADAILDRLDPNRELIQLRLYRDHCIQTPFGYLKDLRIIKNRNLRDMVLVDNSVFSFAFQVNNGIPILPYYHGQQDEELIHLLYYLDCIVELDDVRPHNEQAFGLIKLSEMEQDDLLLEIETSHAEASPGKHE